MKREKYLVRMPFFDFHHLHAVINFIVTHLQSLAYFALSNLYSKSKLLRKDISFMLLWLFCERKSDKEFYAV